jgi:hypothetical protein
MRHLSDGQANQLETLPFQDRLDSWNEDRGPVMANKASRHGVAFNFDYLLTM